MYIYNIRNINTSSYIEQSWSPNALFVSTSTCQKFHGTFQCLSGSFCICGNLEATPTCTMIHHHDISQWLKWGAMVVQHVLISDSITPFQSEFWRIGSSNLHHHWILDRNQVSEIHPKKKTSMFHQSKMETQVPKYLWRWNDGIWCYIYTNINHKLHPDIW